MLSDAATRGACDAAAHFGVKTAGLLDKGIGAAKSLGAFGMAPEAFVQGPQAFARGNPLHWRQVLWPQLPGQPVRQALGRLGTVAAAASLPGMVHSDSSDDRKSRVLGGAGALLGGMYGGTAGGLIGLPIGAALGRGLGHAAGNIF